MRYKFGDLELDLDAYELRRAGAAVPLQPQVFDLLRYLIEHRERVVTKSELFQVLWPGEHVSESALFFCVRSARTALGQEQVDGGPISTVRGRGYRFLAAVQEVSGNSLAPPPLPHDLAPVSASAPAMPSPSPARPPSPSPLASPPAPSPPIAASPPPSSPSFRNHAPARAVDPDAAPFVGRSDVIQALSQALSQAVAGHGRLCLLSGEPGIGKSRCIEEISAIARGHGISVWTARCIEGQGAPAFWPWIQILRQSADEPAIEPTSIEEARALLAMLAPALGAVTAPAFERSGAAQGAERFWLLDRVCRFVLRVSAVMPRLIVFDDIHWADDSSLQLIRMLAGDLASVRCLMLGAVRDPHPEMSADRERMTRQLNRQATRIPLAGLQPDDVGQYVAALTSSAHSDELGRALHARAAGNPLFVREMLRLVLDHPGGQAAAASLSDIVPSSSSSSWVGTPLARVPPLVQDVLQSRIEGLQPRARAILGAASVLGREFELALLRSVAGASGADLADAIDSAVDARILAAVPGTSRYAFVHDLVRDVVYQGLSRVERLRYHWRTGEALEAWSTGERALSEIARHYYLSLPEGRHDKALDYARAAAEAALRVFAFADAARFFGWALEALSYGEPTPRLRAELHTSLGNAYSNLGDSKKSREALQTAIELAESHRFADILAVASIVLRRVTAVGTLADPLALHGLELALHTLPDTQARHRVRVLSRLACIPPYSEDMARSKEMSGRAVELARSLGSDDLLIEALSSRLYSLSGPDDIDEFLAAGEEILRLGRDRPASWGFGEARALRYHALLNRGDAVLANRELAELGRLADQLPYPPVVWNYNRLCAEQTFDEGRLDVAESLYQKLHTQGRSLGAIYADSCFALQILRLQWERYGRCVLPDQLADPTGLLATPTYKGSIVRMLLAEGRREEAARIFESVAESEFAAIPRNLNYLYTMAKLSQAAVLLGDRQRARSLYDALRPYPHHNAVNLLAFCSGSVSHFLGQLAWFLGDPTAAARHFEDALAMNERMHLVICLARTRFEYARLLAEANEPTARERARELVDLVIETAHEVGLEELLASAQALRAALSTR